MSRTEAASEGVLVSLGGLRTLGSDALWLRAYVMWEKRDRAACTAYAQAACAMSPETEYFREGYANWLAFDFPHWTVADLGGFRVVPKARQDEIHETAGRDAVGWLEKELARSPEAYRYAILAGQIARQKLHDPELSSAYMRRAAEMPAGPWYPAMLYANRLFNTGRRKEAVEWLSSYAARLQEDSESRRIATEWIEAAKQAK